MTRRDVNDRPWHARLLASTYRVVCSEAAWVILALMLGAAQAFSTRYQMNSDGLSYLEMGQAALREGAHGLVNGYWSPGYPALIAGMFMIFRPGIAAEFPVVHALNFLIFATAVLVFRQVLRAWPPTDRDLPGAPSGRVSLFVPFAFAVFLWVGLNTVGPSLVEPDIAVLVVTLAIVLRYLRLEQRGSWIAACAVGALCAMAYWIKAVMFPLVLIFLLLAWILPPRISRARAKVLGAIAVWLVLCLPLVVAVSRKVGRLTIGETGRLNYAWNVTDGRGAGAIMSDPSTWDRATLLHPPRTLLRTPRIIEFASPIGGTFPLWYDPSYWFAGMPTGFSVAAQLRALWVNAAALARALLSHAAGVLGVFALGLALIADARLGRRVPRTRPDVVLMWSLAGLVLYGAVHVEPRYLASFAILLAIVVMRRPLQMIQPRAAQTLAAIVAIWAIAQAARIGSDLVYDIRTPKEPQYLELARRLNAMGLDPGDRIGLVGLQDAGDAAFAHAAGLTEAAEIADSTGLATATAAEMEEVKSALATADIRAIVQRTASLYPGALGWRRVVLGDGAAAEVLPITPHGHR